MFVRVVKVAPQVVKLELLLRVLLSGTIVDATPIRFFWFFDRYGSKSDINLGIGICERVKID